MFFSDRVTLTIFALAGVLYLGTGAWLVFLACRLLSSHLVH